MPQSICIKLLLCLVMALGRGTDIDHWGTHFVTSFLLNHDPTSNNNVVVITARSVTDVRLTFHESGFTKEITINAGESFHHVFNNDVLPTPFATVLKKKAVSIESSAKVSVYGYTNRSYTADGFLVLPVPSLGTDYITASIENDDMNDSGAPQIVVVAMENGTTVHVEIKSTPVNKCREGTDWSSNSFTDGMKITFNMDAYDVVNLNCFRDTTGTLVTSNKPVAVLSGCKCVSLPKEAICDHIVEMLPPISDFGKNFTIKAPFGQEYAAMLRVIAPTDGTTFTIKGISKTLASQTFATFNLVQSDVFCFQSSKPVLVVMFMTGATTVSSEPLSYKGDSFMMVVPPINKYTNEYVIDADVFPDYESYALVLLPSAILTANPLLSLLSTTEITGCNGFVYDGFVVNGIRHYKARSVFMVLMYGIYTRQGYGYPAGMKLSDFSGVEECSSNPCENGGWCLEVGSSFRCSCLPRFSGNLCEIDTVDDCLAKPCIQGTCEDGVNSYTCKCHYGYTGAVCDAEIPTTATPIESTTSTKRSLEYTTTYTVASLEDTTLETTKIEDTTSLSTIIEDFTTSPSTSLEDSVGAQTTPLVNTTTAISTSIEDTTTVSTIIEDFMTSPSTLLEGSVRAQTTHLVNTTTAISTSIEDTTTAQASSIDDATTSSYFGDIATLLANTETVSIFTTHSGTTIEPTIPFKQKPCLGSLCQCACPCARKLRNLTNLDIYTQRQHEAIKIDKLTLSKRRRLKNSEVNKLQSETNIGMCSVMLLMVFIGFLILTDLSRCVSYFLAKNSKEQRPFPSK